MLSSLFSNNEDLKTDSSNIHLSPRVRFAPSPTGFLHIGNTRTALFNWVYAKQNNGQFILRMDDTDQQRSEESYVQSIQEDLTWLGLPWDEYYRQGERLHFYEKARDILIACGRLYPCWETPEELENQRKLLLAQRKPPIYNRLSWMRWKKKVEEKGLSFASWDPSQHLSQILKGQSFLTKEDSSYPTIHFAEETKGNQGRNDQQPHWRFLLSNDLCVWEDSIQGHQEISPKHFSDPVVVREDGNISYLLASVVDDIDLGITHVIRGSDHISNTAVQIQLFQSLHCTFLPQFCHFPLLSSLGGQKLSKRLGSLNVQQLRQEGFCPDVVLGSLGNLGSHGLISIDSSFKKNFINHFSFQNYTKSNVQFDDDILVHNQEIFLHTLSYDEFRLLCPESLWISEDYWLLLRENIVFFHELIHWSDLLRKPLFWTGDQWKNDIILSRGILSVQDAHGLLKIGKEAIEKGENLLGFVWQHKQENLFLKTAEGINIPIEKKEVAMVLRLGLTGLKKGPKLQDFIAFFQKKNI